MLIVDLSLTTARINEAVLREVYDFVTLLLTALLLHAHPVLEHDQFYTYSIIVVILFIYF